MSYDLTVDDDGILHVTFRGDFSDEDLDRYLDEFGGWLRSASESAPLLMLANATQSGRISVRGRQEFFRLTKEPRIGRVAAIVGANRLAKIMMQFAIRIVGGGRFALFDIGAEEEALTWLKELERRP